MSASGGVDIKALVAKVTGRPGHAQCWAQFLTGDAKGFVDALEVVQDERPGAINRNDAVYEFGNEFGVELNSARLGYHLRRDCKCRPRI